MLVREFDFDLPPELIAQAPLPDPADARLLCLSRTTGLMTPATVSSLPLLLESGDLLVVNDTRVFPARLLGRRVPSGGAVECLLTDRVVSDRARVPGHDQIWEALMHPGQKLKPGSRVIFEGSATLHGEVQERRFYGRRLLRLWTTDGCTVDEAVDAIGHVPLPPYVKRNDCAADRERYQTVFARQRGSVAAPTAGLHFNNQIG